jgi:hypothetical protein
MVRENEKSKGRRIFPAAFSFWGRSSGLSQNGCLRTMVSSRSGPVEIMSIGTSQSCFHALDVGAVLGRQAVEAS